MFQAALSRSWGARALPAAAVLGSGSAFAAHQYRCVSVEPQKGPVLLIPRHNADNHPSKYSIIIDMDETLLHTNLRDWTVSVRPHSRELLKSVADKAEMVLWTAGVENYAVKALQILGDEASLFHHRIYRNPIWHDNFANGQKELRRLYRDPDYTLLVDNSTHVVHPEDEFNVLVVSDYLGENPKDKELVHVAKLIDELIKSGMTVPKFLKKKARQGQLKHAQGVVMTKGKANSCICRDA